MAVYQFNGFTPVIHPSSYVHPQANVTGDVIIGKDVYIGPGCVLRGDWGRIEVGDGCNVQENCTVHMFPGVTVKLLPGAHIGHGAIIHGAEVGENSLIGMNAVLMDEVVVGRECIVGALCFVPQKMNIPSRSVVVGNPAKVVKEVSDEMIVWKTEGTKIYQELPSQLQETLREVEPLSEVEPNRPSHSSSYKPRKK